MDQPETYSTVPNLLIPMRDGISLAARLYRPNTDTPVPAIVSIVPYQKEGTYKTGYLDSAMRHFSEQGYATLIVDLRGTGDSEGSAPNAFDHDERLDGYDLVQWVGEQDWCTGAVGMWGLSYGGITSLSTASTKPSHLRCIIPIHAATDLYHDYLGSKGCRTAFSPDVHWGTRMAASNLLPPLFESAQADEIWQKRLHDYEPWILNWHKQSTFNEYWRRSIVDVSNIDVPTYLVAGWRDIFADNMIDIFDGLTSTKKLIMGPWKHIFPDLAPVAPIGFLNEMTRWWDRWLRNESNGIEEEPPISYYSYGNDEWRFANAWPPEQTAPALLRWTGDHSLTTDINDSPEPKEPLRYEYSPMVGFDSVAMHWLAGPEAPESPTSDIEQSLVFPLESDGITEITGTPELSILLRSSKPRFPLVARLFAADTEGASKLITLGWLQVEDTPDDSENGDGYRNIRLRMRPISRQVLSTERLILTLSCADISRIWPEPESFTLDFHSIKLILPTMPSTADFGSPPEFQAPEMKPASGVSEPPQFTITHDLLQPVSWLTAMTRQNYDLSDGTTLASELTGIMTINSQHPKQSQLDASSTFVLTQNDRIVSTDVVLKETVDHFQISATVKVNGEEIYQQSWETDIG